MRQQDLQSGLGDSTWTQLTNDLLSYERTRWQAMAEKFEPLDHATGQLMAGKLREIVHDGPGSAEAHAICNGDRLLGFFTVERAFVTISRRAWPIFELRKRKRRSDPQPCLMLGSIARSRHTRPGFGHVLFDQVIGVALQDPRVVAIGVLPDNSVLARVWEHHYHLRKMEDPAMPGLMYFPVDPAPEALWP